MNTYIYAYKTSDGVRHEERMRAPSREEVFASLRKQGIKAIKVVAADGSKANGEIRGVRKRVVALVAIVVAILTGVILYTIPGAPSRRGAGAKQAARPLPRQEIRGSHARVEAAAKSLESRAERFLALFAEPGRPVSITEADWPTKAEFEAVIKKPIEYTEDEFTEEIDLKRMVESLKHEMSIYLRGGGYVSGYIKELVARQDTEKAEREKADKHLKELLVKAASADQEALAAAYNHWMKSNAHLQSMGIYLLPMPAQLAGYVPAVNED